MPFSSKLLQMGAAGAGEKLYVEDVFSTYLYTGNGASQTITNNTDLSTEGGLVWIKRRDGVGSNWLQDTTRGIGKELSSNSTAAEGTSNFVTSANTDGFTVSSTLSASNNTYASWTFRKAKKFFDIVTYTGTQNSSGNGQTVSHNLGSTPGCIIIKPLSDTSGSGFSGLNNWIVYHRGLSSPTTQFLRLNTTNSIDGNADKVKAVSSTTFTAGWEVGLNGIQYVAYLFAHDAGGFGDAGSDSIIKCGSYTGNGSAPGPTITLDWEPQWIMIKRTDSTGNWFLYDNMRGWPVGSDARELYANDSYQEDASSYNPWITSTGFYPRNADSRMNASGGTYIYIAIRRGPMKTPTSGTSVYKGIKYTGNGNTKGNLISLDFPADLLLRTIPSITNSTNMRMYDRLRGQTACIKTHSTATEITNEGGYFLDSNVGVFPGDPNNVGNYGTTNNGSTEYMLWNFRRAPGFFDVVCYTGTGSGPRWIDHNLTTAPQFIIVKSRSNAESWTCSVPAIGQDKFVYINLNIAASTDATMFPSAPTSTQFRVADGGGNTNFNGYTYVAYLFASLSGVSKVGTYTGNGSSVTVTTDFQPRFILVKRTDSTGDWLVSDSARGLVAGNDPYLELNTTDAEVTNEDWVDISSTSFTVNQTTNNANVNTATYIYLAIA